MSELRVQLESGLRNQYDIESELGGGGMARVFVATDKALGRRVVIKVLSLEMAAGVSAKRFQREIRLAASLQQANIVPVLSAGETDGLPHYTMPFVEGLSLRERLLRESRLPLRETIGILRDVARALAYAHERNVVHRDIKPENILLSGGAAVVTDFGIAKALANARLDESSAEQRGSTVTQDGTAVGTPAYMAPEQITGDPDMDHRVDLYAFGCVAYELLSGQPPFGDRPVHALFAAHMSESPVPVAERCPECPPTLARLVMRCLDKSPDARPASAQEVFAALDSVSAAATPFERFRQRLTRRQRIMGSIIVAVALLASGTAVIRGLLTSAARIASVAVLPIENLSGDSAQQYLADGMHDALITNLSRLSGLRRVIARPSVLRYRRTEKPPAEIARELGVDAIVTGSWISVGDRARFSVQLTAASGDETIWVERYDRDIRNVLSLQDEVTRAIADRIRMTISASEESRLARQRSVDPDAYDAYLKGRFHWQRLTRQEVDIAERYFLQALSRDSSWSLPYSSLGMVWGVRCHLGFARCSEVLPHWKAMATKAAQLDPSAPHVIAQQAGIRFYVDWDWAAAGRALPQAIAVDPNNPELRVWHAEYLLSVAGRPDDGVTEMRRALDLDPNNSTQQAWMGEALVYAGRYEEAINYLEQLLARDANAPLARSLLQTALEVAGRSDEAMEVWRRSPPLSTNREIAQAIEHAYTAGGYRAAMRARAEMLAREAERRHIPRSRIAGFYASGGDNAQALNWLEKAVDERETQLVYLKSGPRWLVLRGEPRFQAILRRMNLPP